MPTTYTHDLFGKTVYKKLPEEMKKLLRSHKDLYRIGQHGPDILFYYMISKNPVSQFGVRMHHKDAAAFFERGMKRVREEKDEALLVYMLGFGCHYILDSTAHPYVNRLAEQKVITHTMLEKEFDRVLMLQTGKDPHRYRPSDCIVPKYAYAKIIHKAIPEISTFNIWVSLHMQKLLTNLMICNDGGRRRALIGRLLRLGGEKHSELLHHFMLKDPFPGCEESLSGLQERFEEAAEIAPDYLLELYALKDTPQPLSERWHQTYSG